MNPVIKIAATRDQVRIRAAFLRNSATSSSSSTFSSVESSFRAPRFANTTHVFSFACRRLSAPTQNGTDSSSRQ